MNVTVELWLIELVAGILSLYFHFQLLTDLADLAEEYGWTECRKLLQLRTVHTLLTAFLMLPLPWDRFEVVTILILLIHIVVLLWIMAVLFGLKRYIKETEA